jgi:xanthine dehydrogenase accessory factor
MQGTLFGEVLAETERALRADGRVALCQIVRAEGSTPGKPGWKLVVRADGSALGNLGGGAFEALVKTDAEALLHDSTARSGASRGEPAVKRYYFTEQAVRGEATGMVCGGFADVFLEVLTAAPLLLVCGGGPVGQALARGAVVAGFDVVVADDRDEFLRPELFPAGARVLRVSRDYHEPFLAAFAGRELAVAIVTRCWETDTAALAGILRQAPARLGYLGLMGSRRKIARVRAEVEKLGLGLERVRLYAPIGLPLGGNSPGEIAIAILAELVQVRNAAAGGQRVLEQMGQMAEMALEGKAE